LICGHCGKAFYRSVLKSRISACGGKVYCSRECFASDKKTAIELKCAICNKPIERLPSRIKIQKRVYCSHECKAKSMIGEGNPEWAGGIGYEPYCNKFNDEFKERVRAFFDHECLICGKREGELIRRLHVHHVNYDKKVCCNGNRPLFAAVCPKHNILANMNRDRWQYIFTYIIDEIYGGKCYYTREEYRSLGLQ